MEEMLKPQDNQVEVIELLSQVRSMITAAGCAHRLDAERWLISWLDTPNGALGGVAPPHFLKRAANDSTVR